MTPPELLTAWGELTGEKWRCLPHSVQAQAAVFCAAGFSREELRLVVLYTQKMITREEGGFNAQSITWRVLAEDNWQKFQERLAAARKTRLGKAILSGANTQRPTPNIQHPTCPGAAEGEAGRADGESRRAGVDLLRKFQRGGKA